MAVPNSSYTEIISTTLAHRTGKLADNVTKNNAGLNRMRKKGKVKPVPGGRTIVQELEYAENSTVLAYSGYQTLNISPSDVFTAAEFNYAQYAAAISISGLEMLQNSGEDAIINLLASRVKNAEKSLVNTISVDFYSDGSGSGSKQLGGLQLLVDTTPSTGTVGGIDPSTTAGTFWRNIAYDGGSTATSTNIQSYMNNLAVQLVRGSDRTDLILFDNNYYVKYLASLQSIQRITSDEMAGAGFTSLMYYGNGGAADVVLDGGVGGGCPASTGYFLNTDYIFFRPHVDRNFVPIGDDRFATNQDAMVKLIGFAGNMTISNRKLQGVMQNIS